MPDSSPEAAAQAADDMLDTTSGSQVENTQNQDGNGSDSSATKTADTMLDAVQAALKPKEASPASQEPGSEAKTEADAKAAEGESEEELSEEELKAQSWKTQQRFKKLSNKVRDLTTEADGLRQKATEYDRIVGSISQAGLDTKEVDELVVIGSLIKRDPHAALQRIIPVVQELQQMVGDVLPADLQERVRLGYISEQDAREYNRARAAAGLSEKKAERLTQQQEHEKRQREVTEMVNSSISAAETWEKETASKDPDWHLKRDQVAEKVQLAIDAKTRELGHQFFPNAKEVVEISKKALEDVNKRLASFRPKPTEIRPAAGGASPRSKPAPTTMLDAVRNAL